MQVKETLSEGLKRAYDVVIPAGDLASRLDSELNDLKGKVRINGFRPGKVPLAHLKRVYGRSVMADLVQKQIDEAHKQIVDAGKLRLAMQPKIELSKEQSDIEAALEAKGDLAFKVELEVLPQFELGAFDDITLERPVADVSEDEVERFVQRMADSRRTFTARPEGEGAEMGDKLTVDFVGKIGGEPFEGGDGQGIDVILGSKSFIPGFEEALVGVKTGEFRAVEARFPDNYATSTLAGKDAVLETTVKQIAKPEPLTLDDEFAKGLGFESLEAMRKGIRERLEGDYARVSRDRIKRRLLDELAKRYSFEVPQGLVDQEFGQIWAQVEREQKAESKTFADEGTTEEAARAEYTAIAQRRVRLGLVLAEVGRNADVQITDEEMTRALIERARAFPGQEKEVWDYYRNNQGALAELRAPIYEEKAVDHVLGLAKIEDRKVSPEELLKPEEDEETKATAAEAPAA
ncbi:MAG: trigger factor [Pseudomonadota bacterium]|nr:trigger factor [Pseudomonadota bacterium]